MKEDTIDIELPGDTPEGGARECRMSLELFQNARMTMGEIRDFMRETGISWDFIMEAVERAGHPANAIERALDSMDDYTTGLGRSLHDKPSNIR